MNIQSIPTPQRAVETTAAREARWKARASSAYAALGPFAQLRVRWGLPRALPDKENLVPENPNNRHTRLYLFYCKEHGPCVSYPQGHDERLECHPCLTRWIEQCRINRLAHQPGGPLAAQL